MWGVRKVPQTRAGQNSELKPMNMTLIGRSKTPPCAVPVVAVWIWATAPLAFASWLVIGRALGSWAYLMRRLTPGSASRQSRPAVPGSGMLALRLPVGGVPVFQFRRTPSMSPSPTKPSPS